MGLVYLGFDFMKTILSIFLLAIFLLQPLIKVGILLDYQINRDFIATMLCIKKDQPESNCKGKCYLSQKLEKTDEGQKKELPNSSIQQLETHLYFDFYPVQTLSAPLVEQKVAYYGGEQAACTREWLDGIFRPPENQPTS